MLYSLLFISTGAQTLYESDAFTILSDKVTQDKFTAQALSDVEMTTNYRSTFRKKTANLITFKFSINGGDNEAYPGSDHRFYLDQEGGNQSSPLYEFGKIHSSDNEKGEPGFLKDEVELTIKVDMNRVLQDFKEKGYFVTFSGDTIDYEDFRGVYVAGNTYPLTWNFNSPGSLLELKDIDGDGIYQGIVKFQKEFSPEGDKVESHWKLFADLSAFPSYKSPHLLPNALYNRAMEEMLQDIREDGAFMAGEKWPGVWTRDISYSILLSMAIANPDASKISLQAKVKNKRIIQDTGTGGAWPVSTDRMTWALAAWEVYKVTGDQEWLQYIYEVIKNSAEDDLLTIYDRETGLFCGESSFLDWREQTYPVWMDPKDIYVSKNLGTNAVHYQTYKILAEISRLLNKDGDKYEKVADQITKGLNKHLWIEGKGYYGQYLYGRNFLSLSSRSESLGEALTVLYNISDQSRSERIINCTPVTRFGTPCIYPQIPGIPPYHNDAVWPFVEAFRGWASAKQKNKNAVEHSIASIYRAAALFGTNKENFVATTGDYIGTEINSSRQLWSVAGNMAVVYRILFGLNFSADSLHITPFIPASYEGERVLENIHYREAKLKIKIQGFGSEIESVKLDGKRIDQAVIPGNLKGEHSIEIILNDEPGNSASINLVDNTYTPEMPILNLNKMKLTWNNVPAAVEYDIYKNGTLLKTVKDTTFLLNTGTGYTQYQVLARNNSKRESFLSAPVTIFQYSSVLEAEDQNGNAQNEERGYTGGGYIIIDKRNSCEFRTFIPQDAEYFIDFRYANGNGPINTSNKCALRDLFIDKKRNSVIVFPQRGDGAWNEWGYSNAIRIKLSKGTHEFKLSFAESNNNMNFDVNTAFIDHMRLIPVNPF